MKYISIERNITLATAVKGLPIAMLTKKVGEQNVLSGLYGLIVMMQEYFNVKSPMTEVQAIQTASLLIESYPAETFEDYVMCFKNAKLGKYGSVYNKIDGNDLFKWFAQYLDEKYSYLEQQRHNEKYSEREMGMQMFEEILTKAVLPVIKSNQQDKPSSSGLKESDEIRWLQDYVKTATQTQLLAMREMYEGKRAMTFHHDRMKPYSEQLEILNQKLNKTNE